MTIAAGNSIDIFRQFYRIGRATNGRPYSFGYEEKSYDIYR